MICFRHYYSFWEEPSELSDCDLLCRQSVLCGIYSGDHSDEEPCERIENKVWNNETMWQEWIEDVVLPLDHI